jgi:hypothetical protein
MSKGRANRQKVVSEQVGRKHQGSDPGRLRKQPSPATTVGPRQKSTGVPWNAEGARRVPR